eukprot:COSAG02_NODE_2337_length_9110_cov_417.266837_9_plen_166_part_00
MIHYLIHDHPCTVCCVFATQAPSEPGRSTWERRTSADDVRVCDASLAWGMVSRAVHESTCPHGAQARAQAREGRSQAVQTANDVLKTATRNAQAIEGFPDFPSGVSASVRVQLKEQVSECNRALSAFEGGMPSQPSSTEENSILFDLRRFREELEAVLPADEASD